MRRAIAVARAFVGLALALAAVLAPWVGIWLVIRHMMGGRP